MQVQTHVKMILTLVRLLNSVPKLPKKLITSCIGFPLKRINILKLLEKLILTVVQKDAMSSCQKDASECSILELCEVAATKEVSATNWNEINPRHVKLAKSFGLDFGVKEVQGINQVNKTNTNISMSPCDLNPAACISEEHCERTVYTINKTTEWKIVDRQKVRKRSETSKRKLWCTIR